MLHLLTTITPIILPKKKERTMPLIEQINNGIKDAMRNKDSLRLDTLRMLKSKILTVDARGNLPDADVIKLFKSYLGSLQEGMEQAITYKREEIAAKFKSEIAIVQEFLPKALSPEETRKLVEQAIAESGAKTRKELGLVMKALMKLNNDIDGKQAKDLAFQILTD